MVTIVDFKPIQKDDGSEFYALVVQGGIEAVTSKETNRVYLTARKANVATTFNELTCKSLVGSELPGMVKRVEVEPYQYTVESTGELLTLSHSYVYMSPEQEVIEENIVKAELVS